MKNNQLRILTLAVILVLAVSGALLPANQLLLEIDLAKIPAQLIVITPEETISRMTYSPTLIAAIDEIGLPLDEHDLLSLPDDTLLEPGRTYTVSVSRRSRVTLTWSGYALGTSSDRISMGDLLSRSGFGELGLSGNGRLEVNKTGQASIDGGAITYVQVDKRITRTYETIPFSTITIDDSTQYIGKSSVQTAGVVGERALIFEETYENGVFIGAEQIGIEIVTEPVQKVVLKGTRKRIIIPAISPKTPRTKVEAAFNKIKDLLIKNGNANYKAFKDNGNGTITVDGKTFSYIEVKKRVITMYDGLECCLQANCHEPPINHNTASGIPAQRGLVAAYGFRVDGKFIGTALPLGTTLFVEGYGLAVVADVHGNHKDSQLIDACYDAGEIRSGAVTWGKRTKRVYIISLP